MKMIQRIDSANNVLEQSDKIKEWKSSVMIVPAFDGVVELLSNAVDLCYELKPWTTAFSELVRIHTHFASELFTKDHIIYDEMNDLFVEIEWQLEEEPSVEKDYFLDQVLTVAPVLASKIVFYYLESKGISVSFLDARDLIVTDNTYGNGIIDQNATIGNLKRNNYVFNDESILILPADIGSSTENYGVCIPKGKLEEVLMGFVQ